MAKSFDSGSKTIGEILGKWERLPVVVPRFQRGFSWEKTQVMTFWTDLISFGVEYEKAPTSATYFFGPIVIQRNPKEILLLDGQQRLATATILLGIVRDVARGLKFSKGKPGDDFARDVQRDLIFGKEDVDPSYSLLLGELDQDFFRKSVQNDPPSAIDVKLRSHKLIKSAQKVLQSEVNKLIAGLNPSVSI